MYVPHRSTSRSVSGDTPRGSAGHGLVESSPVKAAKNPAATREGFPDITPSRHFSKRAESEAPMNDPVIDPRASWSAEAASWEP